MRLSVVVPSYGRPRDLAGCLRSLETQRRSPDEVVLVLRDDDVDSRLVAAQHEGTLPLRVVAPQARGFVPALRSGLCAASGDAAACTDDDARPRPDWLERIEAVLASEPDVVAVGGRDVRPGPAVPYRREEGPGVLTWWGRAVGRHEEPWPQAGDVAHLRGVNMAFRAPWPLPHESLCGDGTGNELDMCLLAGRRGRVRFDPAIVVDHLVRPRAEDEGKSRRESAATLSAACGRAHNQALVLARHTPARLQRWARFLFLLAVGQAMAPGWLRVAPAYSGRARWDALIAITAAKARGWRTGLKAS